MQRLALSPWGLNKSLNGFHWENESHFPLNEQTEEVFILLTSENGREHLQDVPWTATQERLPERSCWGCSSRYSDWPSGSHPQDCMASCTPGFGSDPRSCNQNQNGLSLGNLLDRSRQPLRFGCRDPKRSRGAECTACLLDREERRLSPSLESQRRRCDSEGRPAAFLERRGRLGSPLNPLGWTLAQQSRHRWSGPPRFCISEHTCHEERATPTSSTEECDEVVCL